MKKIKYLLIAIDDISSKVSERNLTFDGWRGMAIMLVLVSHFLTIPGFYTGKFGVAAFFVLSGGLMSNILFVKKVHLITFYKRRISRVFPVFLVYISIIYVYAYNISSKEFGNFFYTLSFLRAYLPSQPDMWSTGIPINHLWSLNVEEHCYIILSLITLIFITQEKVSVLLVLLGTGASILFGFYTNHPEIAPPLFQIRTETISSFLFLSAGYYLVKYHFEAHVKQWMPMFAFILAGGCFISDLPWYFPFFIAPCLLTFSFHHLSKFPKKILTIFTWIPLRLIGIWSYSIYIWQEPLDFYIHHYGKLTLLNGALLIVLAIILGAFSYYLIENPIRKYLNKY